MDRYAQHVLVLREQRVADMVRDRLNQFEMHPFGQGLGGGEFQVHVILAGFERRIRFVPVGNLVPDLYRDAQGLGLAGLFRIDTGQDIGFDVGKAKGQRIGHRAPF